MIFFSLQVSGILIEKGTGRVAEITAAVMVEGGGGDNMVKIDFFLCVYYVVDVAWRFVYLKVGLCGFVCTTILK